MINPDATIRYVLVCVLRRYSVEWLFFFRTDPAKHHATMSHSAENSDEALGERASSYSQAQGNPEPVDPPHMLEMGATGKGEPGEERDIDPDAAAEAHTHMKVHFPELHRLMFPQSASAYKYRDKLVFTGGVVNVVLLVRAQSKPSLRHARGCGWHTSCPGYCA